MTPDDKQEATQGSAAAALVATAAEGEEEQQLTTNGAVEEESADEALLAIASRSAQLLTCAVYDIDNYTFGEKEPLNAHDPSVMAKMRRLQHRCEKEGMRRSVEGVLVVHSHGHPHVLLLRVGNILSLPGGRLRPGEDEIAGLKRKLDNKLAPVNEELRTDWEIGEHVATWWRPYFESFMYPYVPPHITTPKECCKQFIVRLPERCAFSVPQNLKLVAVPLFDLYDNAQRYGPVVASLPEVLSKISYTSC